MTAQDFDCYCAKMEKKHEKKDKTSRIYFAKGQIESLITCVEGRRGLWDPEDEEYKSSRFIKLQWWEAIGKILKCDGKYLRICTITYKSLHLKNVIKQRYIQ